MSNDGMFAAPTEAELKETDKMFAAPSEEEIAAIEPAKMSGTDSFLRGAAQVGSMGFGDEALANIFTSVDALTGGEAAKNIAKENEAMGTNLTPYEVARQVSRDDFKQANTDNPNAYLAGGLAAGLATTPLMGAAGSVGGAAALGATIGGVSGLGNSEADLTKGEIGKAAWDTGIGATAGAGLGALAQAAPKSSLIGALGGGAIGYGTSDKGHEIEGTLKGAGIGTVALGLTGLVPDIAPGIIDKVGGTVARNYNYAKETGENVFTKDMGAELAKRYGQVVDKVKAPFIDKQKKIQSSINTAEKELKNLEDLAEDHAILDKQMQISQSGIADQQALANKTELAKVGNKISKKLQDGYAKVLSTVKKNYDKIETEIPEAFKFNVNDEVLNFRENAIVKGGLTEDQAIALTNSKLFKDRDFRNMSAVELKKFREDLQDLKPDQGTMSSVYSDFIEAINTKRGQQLEANPLTANLSKQLKANDLQYSRAMRLQDNHLGQMSVDKNTGNYYGKLGADTINSKTVDTVSSFVDPTNMKNINNSDAFLKSLYEFDPELAKQFQNDMTGYVEQARNLKFAPKSAPVTKEDLLAGNPRVAQLKELIRKANDPEGLSGAEKLPYTKDTDAIDKPIRDNLQTMNDNKEASSKSEYMKSLLAEYEKLTGEELTKKDLSNIEGYRLSGNTDIPIPNVGNNPLNQASQIVKSGASDRFAGAYGRMEKSIQDNKKMSYINNKLNEATTKGRDAINATRFDLLQQPAFREMLSKRKEEKEK